MVIFLERERATIIAIAIVGRAIILERESHQKRTDTKKDANRIKTMNDWMAPSLFRILGVAIIFSPTVKLQGVSKTPCYITLGLLKYKLVFLVNRYIISKSHN